MEKKLDLIVGQVDSFIKQTKNTQTSLQIIKMSGKVEEGRQLLQQFELDLKCSSKPNVPQLKKRATEFNKALTKHERQLSEMQDQLILRAGESSSRIGSDDSDDEERKYHDDDESTGFISGSRGNSRSYRQSKGGGLSNAEKALQKGYAVSGLARNAMVNLRGQRDTLVDTLGTLRSMGNDLARTDQVTKELSMRRFFTIVVLYLLAFCLGVAIIHILYYKISNKL